ncbi:hypothetical protein RB195_002335 [Necator americanus]|uniref:Uncharacterized protein n=1 Tax=Necator americanus TaxID=51031 RepID=A0ABR1DLG7_NECAM
MASTSIGYRTAAAAVAAPGLIHTRSHTHSRNEAEIGRDEPGRSNGTSTRRTTSHYPHAPRRRTCKILQLDALVPSSAFSIRISSNAFAFLARLSTHCHAHHPSAPPSFPLLFLAASTSSLLPSSARDALEFVQFP